MLPVEVEPQIEATSTEPAAPRPLPPDFLMLDTLEISHKSAGATFNERPFAISINVAIPGHPRLQPELGWQLDALGRLGDLVFEEFGGEVIPRLEIHIGEAIPVDVAQAVLAVYGNHPELPVYVGITPAGDFASEQRVYIGGFVHTLDRPLAPELLERLLAPGLTIETLHALLPPA